MNSVAIWFTYDLGVGGDFQSMYAWLDDHEAIECGNNVAFLKYKYSDAIKSDKALDEILIKELNGKIKFNPTNRIYIIRKSLEKGKTIGSYIIGKRKANPWEGYGSKTDNTIDG
jgi:hypothetical protein